MVLSRDKRFARLIRKHGPPVFKWNNLKRGNVFQSLCRSIIYQQISGKAARATLARFAGLFHAGQFPTPLAVRRMPALRMRRAGLSGQKVSYLKDLALKFSDGTIKHRSLARMTNDEIVEHLVQVRGIGAWTAQMFLIFALKRPDVLPTGDYAVRKGFQIVYGLRHLPGHNEMERLAKPWRAHASAASWYFWRASEKMQRREKSAKGGSPARGGQSASGGK